MVEVSPALRALQWRSLACAEQPPSASGAAGEGAAAGARPATGPRRTAATTPAAGVSGLAGCGVTWHGSLGEVPQGGGVPSLFIAHELFDALPVHQFVRDPQRGWLEKLVDVADEEEEEEAPPPGGEGSGGGAGASSSSGSGRSGSGGARAAAAARRR